MKYFSATLLVLSTIVLSPSLLAQEAWTYQTNTHRFVVLLETHHNLDSSESYFMPSKVKIYTASGSSPIQELLLEEGYGEYDPGMKDSYFSEEDINFDGYPDAMLELGSSVSGGFRNYWGLVFNPATGRFAFCKELEGIYDPWFNQEQKYVHSFLRTGFDYFGHSIYKWINGQLVQVLEQSVDFDDKVITQKWVNGQWVDIEWPVPDLKVDSYRHKQCDLYKALED